MQPIDGQSAEARDISTAPQREDEPILLFCPDQGGWHSGIWFRGFWLACIDSSTRLDPTHWLPRPPDPEWREQKASPDSAAA